MDRDEDEKVITKSKDEDLQGMQFKQGQENEVIPGSDWRTRAWITCHVCNRKGYYSDNCPKEEGLQQHNSGTKEEGESNSQPPSGETGKKMNMNEIVEEEDDTECESHSDGNRDDESVIMDFQFVMAEIGMYDDRSIFIDTGSMFSVMKNPKMLVKIRKSKKVMNAETNGGTQESRHKAFLPGFLEVWFKKESKFNILLWKDVRKMFRIIADTDEDNSINVHLTKTRLMKFMEIVSGLYIWRPEGVKVDGDNTSSKPISAYSFLNLVIGNKKHFTAR